MVVHDAGQDVVAPSVNLHVVRGAALGAVGHATLDVEGSVHVVSGEVAADHVMLSDQAHERIVRP